MEELEDVHRFQELDSDDEKNGVTLDPGFQRLSNGKQPFNPDELYFNDMDIRAWERRRAELDGLAYGDDYGYPEDEGYYDDAGDVMMSAAEYEELLFQRVLDKIRLARATGEADVQLTPEELEVYQAKMWRTGAPAARPQAVRARPVSAPIVHGGTSSAVATVASNNAASNSTRSKKGQRRSSIFGSSKPKKERTSGRSRAPSTSTNATIPQLPPGFVVPGPNGQPVYAPINGYQGRIARDTPARPPGSPSRHSSRSSASSDRAPPTRSGNPAEVLRGVRQAQTPPRITPPREIPGAFPSGSPRSYREPSPPQSARPASSSSRQSTQESAPKLVPLPIHTTDPYQYQSAGHIAQPSAQPQYARRVASGPPDAPYNAMPRRVPVPVQRATAAQGAQGSYSDPALPQRGSRAEVSDEDDGYGGILVDVVPQADDRSYKVRTSTKEGSSGGSGRDSERRRKSGRSRRKN